MPYRQVIVSSGKPARKAGKRVWEVDIYVRGLPRYQKRHYGTRTEIAREEVKIQKIGFYRRNQKSDCEKIVKFGFSC